MLGIEKAYGNAAIQALLHANRNLMEATVEDAVRVSPRYGKPDTLGLDAIPEISITTQVKKYDQHSILITEEASEWPGFYTSVPADPRSFRTPRGQGLAPNDSTACTTRGTTFRSSRSRS